MGPWDPGARSPGIPGPGALGSWGPEPWDPGARSPGIPGPGALGSRSPGSSEIIGNHRRRIPPKGAVGEYMAAQISNPGVPSAPTGSAQGGTPPGVIYTLHFLLYLYLFFHQSSIITHHSSIISHQSSVISHQLSLISHP